MRHDNFQLLNLTQTCFGSSDHFKASAVGDISTFVIFLGIVPNIAMNTREF